MNRLFSLVALNCVFFLVCFAASAADENTDANATPTPASPDAASLARQLEELRASLNKEQEHADKIEKRVRTLEWDADRDYFTLPNGWLITTHGEFRTRALCEANTFNNYTNNNGQTVFAYNPRSTLQNDYGWWDSRVLSRSIVNFGGAAELIFVWQLGNWNWGNRAPAFGHHGDAKWDHAGLIVRELWVRYSLDPIPLYMEFGRMPWVYGNRIVNGLEHDGARGYYRHKYFEAGFGGAREYEGEPIEMSEKYNDEEDIFTGWLNITPARGHKLASYLWLDEYQTAAAPVANDPESPLYKLPNYREDFYRTRSNDLTTLGANYVGDLGAGFRIDLEYDHQFGEIKPTPTVEETGLSITKAELDRVKPIRFKGQAALARLDYKFIAGDAVALIAGYGSGDDPKTTDYEGFFAPYNDFGMRDETARESFQRGYFNVYEFLAPGAGVPGRLNDNLGSGGIENTTFANLAWDSWFLPNHHFYLSVGYIKASQKNPVTDSDVIGIENDARVDYIFSNNVTFSLYGGHLFILGDYFRKDAHDAASLRGEWKLSW